MSQYPVFLSLNVIIKDIRRGFKLSKGLFNEDENTSKDDRQISNPTKE